MQWKRALHLKYYQIRKLPWEVEVAETAWTEAQAPNLEAVAKAIRKKQPPQQP
jgi:hypothetical protein